MKKLKNPLIIAALITGIIITVTGVMFRQSFFKMLPLYISLVVGYFNSGLNRFGPLVGALNSLLYTAVYISMKLYAMAFYAFTFSFVLQLVTFIRWSKHPYKETTVFKKLTAKQRILTAAIFAVVWVIMYMILRQTDGEYSLLDDTVSMLGILSTVLMMLSFIEYTWLNIPNNAVNLLLYVTMLIDQPEQITYAVYTLYSLLCALFALFKARKTIKEQEEEKL